MNPNSQTINALCSLTPAQAIAVDHLVCGSTHTVAAKAAGVTRSIVASVTFSLSGSSRVINKTPSLGRSERRRVYCS
jgi:hypothetical protein